MGWNFGASIYRERPTFALADEPLIHGGTRRELLAERVGHGRNVTGGLKGPEVTVSTVEELVAALALDGPTWITYEQGIDDYFTAPDYLIVPEDKTVDGRGSGVIIENYGFRQSSHNVIVTDLTIDFTRTWENEAPPTQINYNGPGYFEAGWPVYDNCGTWLHHLRFVGNMDPTGASYSDTLDDCMNVPRRCKYVTGSWCHFELLNKASLVGNDNVDVNQAGDYITWHHNWFDRCIQRQPLVRFNRNFHIFNNWFDRWGLADGSGGAAIVNELGSAVLIEANVFDAWATVPAATLPHAYGGVSNPGDLKNVGNLLNAGCFLTAARNPTDVPVPDYAYTLDTANQALRDAITAGVGPR